MGFDSSIVACLRNFSNFTGFIGKRKIVKDEEPFYGEVPDLEGVWATGKTLEECRRHLAATIEDWLLFSIAKGLPISPLGI